MAGGTVVRGTADTSRIEAPVTVKAYLMCTFAAFGGIFFGYDTGWMSGVLAMPYYIQLYTGLDYLPPGEPTTSDLSKNFALPAWQKSLVTSILSAGTFIGAIVAGDLADFIGRRMTIIGGCAVFTVGGILETASTTLAVMTIGRFVAGLGVGFISAIVILYMSEIAPKKVRGALVAGYQFCITIGILLANCVVYATQNRLDSGSYRIPVAIQFLWAIIIAVGLFLLPESPRYFVKKGRVEDALKALASVRGQPQDSQYIQDELTEIIANHEYELSVVPQTSYLGGWTNCFKGSVTDSSSNLRRSIVGIGLQMMQQLTGINFIFYFGTSFFQTLGTIKDPFLISMIITLVNVCSTPISFYTVERIGRRRLLIYGGSGMVVAQFVVAIMGVTSTAAPVVAAMIAFIAINIFFFATTWGPVAWIVVGEIFPLPIRSRGVGLSTASNWLWNCIIGVITPYMVSSDPGAANLGPKVFFIWASLCCASVAFAYFLVPETKGLSLEQIDRMLEEVTPRKSLGWVPHSTFASEMGMTDNKLGAEAHTVDDAAVERNTVGHNSLGRGSVERNEVQTGTVENNAVDKNGGVHKTAV